MSLVRLFAVVACSSVVALRPSSDEHDQSFRNVAEGISPCVGLACAADYIRSAFRNVADHILPSSDEHDQSYVAEDISPCVGSPDPHQQLRGKILLRTICQDIKGGGKKFLVFGLGYDSPFWFNNAGGEVVFLENHKNWLKYQHDGVKNATRIVKYTSHARDYETELEDHVKLAQLLNSLPEDIKNTHWDTILVDSPEGMEDGSGMPLRRIPGRVQSVFAASQLARAGTVVYVDDYYRHIESKSTDALFGSAIRLEKVYGHTARFIRE